VTWLDRLARVKIAIESEIGATESLLATLHPSRVIERIGLEGKLPRLNEELRDVTATIAALPTPSLPPLPEPSMPTAHTSADVCLLTHAALRKHADSKITSLAYNLIHLICSARILEAQDPWLMYGALVVEKIQQTHGKMDLAARLAARELQERFFKDVRFPNDTAHTAMQALAGTLDLFSDDDWRAFTLLLEEK